MPSSKVQLLSLLARINESDCHYHFIPVEAAVSRSREEAAAVAKTAGGAGRVHFSKDSYIWRAGRSHLRISGLEGGSRGVWGK